MLTQINLHVMELEDKVKSQDKTIQQLGRRLSEVLPMWFKLLQVIRVVALLALYQTLVGDQNQYHWKNAVVVGHPLVPPLLRHRGDLSLFHYTNTKVHSLKDWPENWELVQKERRLQILLPFLSVDQ